MVYTKFFSRDNVVKTAVILFGLSIFSAVIPAELPKERNRPVFKKVLMWSAGSPCRVYFKDAEGKDIRKPIDFSGRTIIPREVLLPIYPMRIQAVPHYIDKNAQADYLAKIPWYAQVDFSADEIKRLHSLFVEYGNQFRRIWETHEPELYIERGCCLQ